LLKHFGRNAKSTAPAVDFFLQHSHKGSRPKGVIPGIQRKCLRVLKHFGGNAKSTAPAVGNEDVLAAGT